MPSTFFKVNILRRPANLKSTTVMMEGITYQSGVRRKHSRWKKLIDEENIFLSVSVDFKRLKLFINTIFLTSVKYVKLGAQYANSWKVIKKDRYQITNLGNFRFGYR